ncbi:MAG: DegT/DnrJ/EryC1/StrS family aminotransferase [Prevotellaceae bacterium]|nr:DegT/DnrJ/EryC1/StrS family aminotransferase [Prevotellaceae bacterium]
MVDLKSQYQKIQNEIDKAVLSAIRNAAYINGPEVKSFQKDLEQYTGVAHVVPCANGTDALQIALMALDLQPGDEVIVPAFTYVASAEVIGLLRLTPVMVDVDYDTFNISVKNVEKGLSSKTKAIIPVHLFGQSCDMTSIMDFAKSNDLYVIEDNAQAMGAYYQFSDRSRKQTGTVGHVGCTSFFPTKNLACYGDGGAMMSNDETLAQKLRMIASHGQSVKYHHEMLGCNSRLDTLQAAVLRVKLKYLDEYSSARYRAAQNYNELLKDVNDIVLPYEAPYSSHVYHQYTVKINDVEKRDSLKSFLRENGIPSMIYYPLPMNEQKAFQNITRKGEDLTVSEKLAKSVLSLPMHTELTVDEQIFIADKIKQFFKAK